MVQHVTYLTVIDTTYSTIFTNTEFLMHSLKPLRLCVRACEPLNIKKIICIAKYDTDCHTYINIPMFYIIVLFNCVS